MGEVVRLPRGSGQEAEAEARAQRAARFEALERVLRARPLMGRADQLRVAEALWRLLHRAEQGNIRKAQVLRAAGIGTEADSTKHLSQYALDPSLPEVRKERARLNKRPHKYREIAEAAARLAGWDAREAVLEVFRETTLAGTRPGQDAAPEYEALARTLREIADAVAAKHGLQEYFREVAESKPNLRVLNDEDEDGPTNKLSPEDIDVYFDHKSDGLDWPISFHEGSGDRDLHDWGGSVPPYPTVVLGKWDVGDEFRICIESDAGTDGSGRATPENRTVIGGQYSAELRLCIIPEGPDMIPTGALRVASLFSCQRSWIEGELTGPFIGFDDLISHPDDDTEGSFGITSDKQNVWCRLRCVSGDEPDLIAQYNLGRVRGCRFQPLTGQVCQDWLGIELYDCDWSPRERPLHVRVLGPALLDLEYLSGISPFPTDSIASALDRCLSGAGEWDLLALFDERAARLVELLADAQEDAKRSRSAGYRKLAARLRAMRDGNKAE